MAIGSWQDSNASPSTRVVMEWMWGREDGCGDSEGIKPSAHESLCSPEALKFLHSGLVLGPST